MAESSSSICAICLEAVRDARLLDCLHSFCKACLDDLDMRTGHQRKIKCPVCRSTSSLPENGAAGLPRDITVAGEITYRCYTCSTEEGEGKPEVSCTTCHLGFCTQHGISHMMANTGHNLQSGPPPTDGALLSARPATTSTQLCEEHALPSRYFCQQCKMTICGDCALFGVHRGHESIVSVKDFAKDLQQRLSRKTELLKNTWLPRMQKILSAVEDVSSKLSSTSEAVRTRIRSSAKCVHDVVDMAMHQRLAEVDDLEELRLKRLDCQGDELKRHTECVKSVVRFFENLSEATVETEAVFPLMLAVEKRADEVHEEHVEEEPVEHARLDFESVSEETVRAKVDELFGALLPCQSTSVQPRSLLRQLSHGMSMLPVSLVDRDLQPPPIAQIYPLQGQPVLSGGLQTAASEGLQPQSGLHDHPPHGNFPFSGCQAATQEVFELVSSAQEHSLQGQLLQPPLSQELQPLSEMHAYPSQGDLLPSWGFQTAASEELQSLSTGHEHPSQGQPLLAPSLNLQPALLEGLPHQSTVHEHPSQGYLRGDNRKSASCLSLSVAYEQAPPVRDIQTATSEGLTLHPQPLLHERPSKRQLPYSGLQAASKEVPKPGILAQDLSLEGQCHLPGWPQTSPPQGRQPSLIAHQRPSQDPPLGRGRPATAAQQHPFRKDKMTRKKGQT